MNSELGLKELYSVLIKSTYQMEIGNRTIEPGEVIASFDKIMIAGVDRQKNAVAAHGGKGDINYVFWDTSKDTTLAFTQGIFSKTQFALLNNTKLLQTTPNTFTISNREFLETDENGYFEIKETPSSTLYVYKRYTGDKLTYTKISDTKYQIATKYCEIIVDYEYYYGKSSTCFKVGDELFNGYVSLEGRTKVKEDITGQVKTGIIKIPKLKIMSSLSLRLGQDAQPVVGNFNAVAIPTRDKGVLTNVDIFFLEDDIDSDM